MIISGTEIAARVEMLRINRKETRDEVAAIIGKNKQVFIDWRNHDRIPVVEDLYKLSLHFGVSINYLVFGEEKFLPDDIALINGDLIQLTPEQRATVKAITESLVRHWSIK